MSLKYTSGMAFLSVGLVGISALGGTLILSSKNNEFTQGLAKTPRLCHTADGDSIFTQM